MMRFAVLSLVFVLLASNASAQQRHQGDSTKAMQGRQMDRPMMQQKVQEADARLDGLVSQMNRTTGSKKIQAMAAVINELVAQRKQMHQRMGQMMESGMMERAQPAGADSGDHSEHHDSVK